LDRIEIYLNGGPAAVPPFSFGSLEAAGPQSPNQVISTLQLNILTEGMGFLDADLDGDLDLLVENDAAGMALLVNDGVGNLTVVDPVLWGLPTAAVHGDYLAVADYDGDGWVDFLARKEGAPDLYRNVGGTFVVEPSLEEETSAGNRGGVGFCDFDADGDLDVFWTDGGRNQIWRNDGGTFVATGEPTISAAVVIQSGIDDVACGDVDLDGDVDFFLSADTGVGYLFLNETPAGGDLAFRLESGGIDPGIDGEVVNGEAATFADVDRDGDLDLYLQADGTANQLWLGGAADAGGAYLVVRALRCLPGVGYRDDIGALVRLYDSDGVTPRSPQQEVNGGRGHGTQDPAWVHFGLPLGAEEIYEVEVRFLGDGGLPGPVVRQAVRPADLVGYRLLEVRDIEGCQP
jgi:hypothetical protein